jgi:NitT/TauT family transport system permease protein
VTARLARPVVAVVALVGLWWGGVIAFDVATFLLPSPADVAGAFARHGPYLARESWVTIAHTVGGFSLAVAAGLVVAVWLAAFPPLRESALPLLVAMQAVPKVAVAPLLIIWLGFGPSSKIALVALLCFFPVVVAALAGLTSTPAELTELARSLSASRWQTFAKIRIPHALPQVFTGLRVAMSLALIGAVVAQLTNPNSGLGAVIVVSRQSVDTPLAFAAITLLAAIGIGLYYPLAALERFLLPWARETTG